MSTSIAVGAKHGFAQSGTVSCVACAPHCETAFPGPLGAAPFECNYFRFPHGPNAGQNAFVKPRDARLPPIPFGRRVRTAAPVEGSADTARETLGIPVHAAFGSMTVSPARRRMWDAA